MNLWTYLALYNCSCIGAIAYLVTHDCPWWALLVILMMGSVTEQLLEKKP
jgi:hypothetical protein